MATQTLISPGEYLHMSFEGPEPEYIDGELMERSMPQAEHSRAQLKLGSIFYLLEKQHDLSVFPELTVHVTDNRFRIPDISVYAGKVPLLEVSFKPPLIVIEVLSPDDSLLELQRRFDDFRRMGTPHTWLADPWSRQLSIYTAEGLRRVDVFELPEYGIGIPASAIFN